MRKALLLACFILFRLSCLAQDSTAHSIPLKKVKLYGGIGYTTGLFVLSQAWYAENGFENFKFFNDNAEWLQVDKFGHTYSTYHFSRINYQLLRRTELSDEKALIWGSLLSTALFLPIEILDGFSPDYGFSYGDMVANAAGSGLFYAQQKLWDEQRIKPKFSFRTTNYPGLRPEILGKSLPEQLLKDYNGQSYWFSIDLHAFDQSGHWPKWLNLAVGYGAEGMVFSRNSENSLAGFNNYRQLFLGIDFDLSYIPTSSRFLKTVLFLADMIRLPAPTLELSNGSLKGHWLYY
ncbi:DUF2279 domain-containing protein [Roseivirga sp.]|uniref:DUF2279 domain-containing protein n=1 Tax=Roseivirga sp. TaxID=1964215 RepID=UPI003B51AE9F